MNLNADIKYPLNAHDFRLVDRKVINSFKDNSNLFPYVGDDFCSIKKPYGIEYDRETRKKGKSKLGLYNTFTYAVNALLEETFFFTKIFRRISMLLFFLGSVGTILNIFQNFKFLNLFENFIVILIISIFVLLSIVCEYVTRIYFQLKKTERIIYEKKLIFNQRNEHKNKYKFLEK